MSTTTKPVLHFIRRAAAGQTIRYILKSGTKVVSETRVTKAECAAAQDIHWLTK